MCWVRICLKEWNINTRTLVNREGSQWWLYFPSRQGKWFWFVYLCQQNVKTFLRRKFSKGKPYVRNVLRGRSGFCHNFDRPLQARIVWTREVREGPIYHTRLPFGLYMHVVMNMSHRNRQLCEEKETTTFNLHWNEKIASVDMRVGSRSSTQQVKFHCVAGYFNNTFLISSNTGYITFGKLISRSRNPC